MPPLSRRKFLFLLGASAGAAWLGAACDDANPPEDDGGLTLSPGSGDGSETPGTVPTVGGGESTPDPTQEPGASPTEDSPSSTETPTAEPTEVSSGEPTGYFYPVAGVHVPDKDSQLPNAARDYRCGFHEGLDFYPYDSGPYFPRGEPVLAAKAGTVIRADHDFSEYSTEQRNSDLATICAQGGADPNILDRLRGRQVWVEHGDGNTTRYCHLNSVAGVSEGDSVEVGTHLAGVGNSGTSNGAAGTDMDLHLHFEVRLGGPDGPYLGAGDSVAEVRRKLDVLFTTA
ncbi:MAG: M23 family metallopeptidase [Dehalococcoidia bacterium]